MNTSQAAFEKWLQSERVKFANDMHESAIRAHFSIIEIYGPDIWQAAMRQAIPDGYVLVPKEPTQEMCVAGQHKALEWPAFPLRISPIYSAMIAAGQVKEQSE